ncbi:MAG: hypothetical protein RMK52_05410 [Chitinophagales bacterium]|nr:hypothetical protein [Chitinophagales bacterium]MDW8393666.1 hypothetical protein [Chitinophagales bacterium]
MGVRHSPLHPANNVAVDFRIKASDADCIKEARLYIYEYETYVSDKGMQSARKRDGGTWGLVKTWSYSMHPKDINESYCKKGGFPAHSYVTYVFSVTDKKGNVACESWSFAAGDWQFGTSPIPLLGNGAPASRIDVCFVADRDDYASARAMLGDLEKLIFDGYHINNGVKRGKKYWQFYYSPERGNITDFDASPRSMEIPGSVSSSSIIDHAAIIHTTVLRDWASGGNFGTEPTNIGTAVHESGHAAFNLKDEYNGGGHSTSTNPHHNNYNSLSSCQTYNTNNGWPASDCENIQSGWWRPEPASLKCIMWDDGDASMPSFQRTCLARIDWFYSNL